MKLKPQHTVLIVTTLAAIAVVVVLSASAGNAPGATRSDGSLITYRIAEGEAGASVELPITLQEGNDAAHESVHIFEQIAVIPGTVDAALDTATLMIEVGYDPAVTDGATIRQELFLVGYTPLAREDTTPTEVAADGSSQQIEIAADGRLAPRFVVAKAGVPAELVFSAGTGCLTSVSFPDLSITQDISSGGTVSLPAMEPGVYAIVCSENAFDGAIVVE